MANQSLASASCASNMAGHGFFLASTTFTSSLLAQQMTCSASAYLSNHDAQYMNPADQSPTSCSDDQPSTYANDEALFSTSLRSHRRLSAIKEETEEDLANAMGRLKLGQRRISLEKGGWMVLKGAPTSPSIEGEKQSSEVQAHISSPPRALGVDSNLKLEHMAGFNGLDQ